jgi:hypothetical protein
MHVYINLYRHSHPLYIQITHTHTHTHTRTHTHRFNKRSDLEEAAYGRMLTEKYGKLNKIAPKEAYIRHNEIVKLQNDAKNNT